MTKHHDIWWLATIPGKWSLVLIYGLVVCSNFKNIVVSIFWSCATRKLYLCVFFFCFSFHRHLAYTLIFNLFTFCESQCIYIDSFYEWVSNYVLFLCQNNILHMYYSIIESPYVLDRKHLYIMADIKMHIWCLLRHTKMHLHGLYKCLKKRVKCHKKVYLHIQKEKKCLYMYF
jgi:hypothetical protein